MGNFITSVIILLLVISFTAINSTIICSICDEMVDLIDSGRSEQAIALWNEKREYIAIFVRDAEIDVVSSEAEALGRSVSLEDGEAELGMMRFRESVLEIKNSEKVNFRNIF